MKTELKTPAPNTWPRMYSLGGEIVLVRKHMRTYLVTSLSRGEQWGKDDLEENPDYIPLPSGTSVTLTQE